jgi:PAS domain S-box-containing protein
MEVENPQKSFNEPDRARARQAGEVSRSIADIPGTTIDFRQIKKRFSPFFIMVLTIGGIVLAEVVAMFFVYFYRTWPYYLQVVLDASIMVVIIFPILYFLSFKPLLLHIQERDRFDQLIQARLRLIQFADEHTDEELFQATLDELEALTGSTIGFFHLVETDQKTLRMQAWSTNTLQNMCTTTGKDSHYSVERAGVWADCIRQRQPVIHNAYASLKQRKGMPAGHAPLIREMVVPIMRNGEIVAILGVGNKSQDFTPRDVELVSTLADLAWDTIQNKRAEAALRESEQKFRTLADWTYDWEKWLDPRGNIVYMSPSCERFTGYSSNEFVADPDLLSRIVHPDDRQMYLEHQQLLHDESAGPTNIKYRIIARAGDEHWIEHICRPLFGPDQRYLGRRISNRDITDRKRTENELRESEQKEKILIEKMHAMQIDIARDLHDTLGQNIGYLRMKLEHLSETDLSNQSDIQAEIQSMSQVANESYDLMRGMLSVLQIKNSADLLYLFSRYSEQVAERSTFEIDFVNDGKPILLPAHQMRHLFFIFREALSNIEKHACASQVQVDLAWNENGLTLKIVDNGKGFDIARTQKYGNRYGLKFMRERIKLLNGSLDVHSEIDSGTSILINVPRD